MKKRNNQIPDVTYAHYFNGEKPIPIHPEYSHLNELFEKYHFDIDFVKGHYSCYSEIMLLFCAITTYLKMYCMSEDNTPDRFVKILRTIRVDENDQFKVAPFDALFSELQLKDPSSNAVKFYQAFKTADFRNQRSAITNLLEYYLVERHLPAIK